MDGRYYNLWSTDNDKTVPNDDVVIKSVYDPSPVGYSLPASNAFTGFTTTGLSAGTNTTPATPEQINVKLPFDKGYYFYTKKNKQGNIFFFPISGRRQPQSGIMGLASSHGYSWDSGPYSLTEGRTFCLTLGIINPLDYYRRNYGLPVRSAEEKKS